MGTAVIVLVCGGLFFAVGRGVLFANATPTPKATRARTEVPTFGAMNPTVIPTNTKIPIPSVVPTLSLPTVTPAPPTATITPTRGPCVQKAGKGDTIYGLAAKCGHKHLSIVDMIVEINGLKNANSLQEGQTIEIPWPTATGDAVDTGGGLTPGVSGNQSPPEATLPPGVIWYTVKKGDTAISVAYKFNMFMSSLRDLNPEIQFLQCDFSQPSGGKDCTLRPLLGEGQRIRVQAPASAATPTPTSSGSETITPTPTATFNAPYSQSPDENMLYQSSELPVLRWVASGELGANQVYFVIVRDLTANLSYNGVTRELSFQVPADWQPADGTTHTFQWLVALANNNSGGTPVPSALTTDTRTFTWQSR